MEGCLWVPGLPRPTLARPTPRPAFCWDKGAAEDAKEPLPLWPSKGRLLQLEESGHSILKGHTFYINKIKRGRRRERGWELAQTLIYCFPVSMRQMQTMTRGSRNKGWVQLFQACVFPLQGGSFAETGGNGRPGWRNPRKPTESASVWRPEAPAPCPYPPALKRWICSL